MTKFAFEPGKYQRGAVRFFCLFICVCLISALIGVGICEEAEAKTKENMKAENVFVYATNSAQENILLKVVTLDELKSISHGQLSGITTGSDTGKNYYYSSVDNYPALQYCEARGITPEELLKYSASNSSAAGAGEVTISGGDEIKFMASDSYGSYARSWSLDSLQNEKRYYFEGLFDSDTGWNPNWEVSDEEDSKKGFSLDTYNSLYRADDEYYDAKRAVFKGGVQTAAILATESYSGRTAIDALSSSSEIGIESFITANGGTVAGCLSGKLEDDTSLRLCLPMSEADIMGAHRNSYDFFRWIYNISFDIKSAELKSSERVAKPEAAFSPGSNGKLNISLSCATEGAKIYYSLSGAPQTLYTGAFSEDVSNLDLNASPFKINITAVKEGCSDEGLVTYTYPEMAPSFEIADSGIKDASIVFTAGSGITDEAWQSWTSKVTSVKYKNPGSSEYSLLTEKDYSFDDNNKTLTFNKTLFSENGAYGFTISASGYVNKNLSASVKSAAPSLNVSDTVVFGEPLVISFEDEEYQNFASVYVGRPGKEMTLISSTFIDSSVPGKLIIKDSYFSQDFSVMKTNGEYTVEVSNNNYSPSSRKISFNMTGGAPDTSESDFSDVKMSDWYYEAVKYAVDNNLFLGVSDTKFAPDIEMTRGMFVTVLGRMKGIDTSLYSESNFTDVSTDKWYAPFVEWASQEGIVKGIGNGKFAPDISISRQEIIAILFRYGEFTGQDMSGSQDLQMFSDSGQVSQYALESMRWAVGKEYIKGMDGGRLNPLGTATRAQVAQILFNYQSKE